MTLCKLGFSEIEVEMLTGKDGKQILHFRHPINGEWYETIDVILHDMNDYYDRKKSEMGKLVQNIKGDTTLKEIVDDGVKEKEYN